MYKTAYEVSESDREGLIADIRGVQPALDELLVKKNDSASALYPVGSTVSYTDHDDGHRVVLGTVVAFRPTRNPTWSPSFMVLPKHTDEEVSVGLVQLIWEDPAGKR